VKLADGYQLDEAVPLGDLRPHPKNPNQGDVGAIVDSIETVGFYGVVIAQKPNGTRKNGRILAGEHRWRAAKAEGATTIPVCWVDVDDEDADRILLGDNQIARLALMDQATQAAMLQALAATERGLSGTGTDNDDLDSLLEELANTNGRGDVAKDKTDPDAPEMTADGDLWTLGRHRLVCGDSFDAAVLAKLTDGLKVDMVWTDPPYGMDLDTKFGDVHERGGDYRRVDGDDAAFNPKPLFTTLSTVAEQFWWGADYYRADLPSGGAWIVWDKRSTDTDEGRWDKSIGNQFELCWTKHAHRRELARVEWCGHFGLAGDDTTSRVHPTQKPVKLVRWFFDRYKGDVVLDLFAGSGPVAIACEDTGRTALLVEKDRRYCDLIAKRWADYTGQTPGLNGTPRPIE
jgi:DNA modification methylase